MPEVVKVNVLNPDILVDGQLLTTLYQPIEFTDLKAFTLPDDPRRLLLNALHGHNAVKATCWDKPTDLFYPTDREGSTSWTMIFGRNPNQGIFHTFGHPQPTLTAEFLGHSERDLWIPLIEVQNAGFNPELTANLGVVDADQYRRTLITTGPVLQTNLHGIDIGYAQQSSPQEGFNGKAMFAVELCQSPWKLGLLPLLATLDCKEGLLRIIGQRDETELYYSNKDFLPTLEALLKKTAQIIVFARALAEPDVKCKEEYKWYEHGLPLQILTGLFIWLKDTPKSQYTRSPVDGGNDVTVLDKRYGFNWKRILKTLPESEVFFETRRLTDVVQNLRADFPENS